MESTTQKVNKGENIITPKNKQEQYLEEYRLSAKIFLEEEGAKRSTIGQGKMPIFSI